MDLDDHWCESPARTDDASHPRRAEAKCPNVPCEVPCAGVDQSADIISHDLGHCFVHHSFSVQASLVRLTRCRVSVSCSVGVFQRRIKAGVLKLHIVPRCIRMSVVADTNLELTSYHRQGGGVASLETGMGPPVVTAPFDDLTTEAPDVQLISFKTSESIRTQKHSVSVSYVYYLFDRANYPIKLT